MEKLAKRIRSSNKQYFDAGWTLGRRRRVTFFWWRPMSAVSSARQKRRRS